MILNRTPYYVTGGTLTSDAPSYVERRADRDLYDGLTAGEFCYVLTPRQMGKSSLMVRTAERLRRQGAAVAVLDLTAVGQNLSAEQWYDGLIGYVGRQLDLEDAVEDFWLANARLGPLQRWMRALREVILPRRPGRVVVFVDEIDAVRSLPFSTDEFFAAIRERYNRRTQDPELSRLTFCLLGVATPSDLIRDTRTTPFNIGRRIELADFTAAEAAPLADGLHRPPAQAARLLQRVLYWTGGQPYLTQRLCLAVAEQPGVVRPVDVDRVCQDLFLCSRARQQDTNLLAVRERLLRSEVDLAGLLELYGRVWRKPIPDDETNPLIGVLRLSGIARVVRGSLRVRNRIYERVFDRRWVEANMPDAEKRRQRRAYRRGLLRASAALGVILIIVSYLGLFAWYQLQEAKDANRRRANVRVEQLWTAAPEAVPELLKVLAEDRGAVAPRLRELWNKTDGMRHHRMRAGLFLFNEEPDIRARLAEWMLEADDPREVVLVRDQLSESDALLAGWLWDRAETEKALLNEPRGFSQRELGHRQQQLDRHFRALAALAKFDPTNPRWQEHAVGAVNYLLEANPLHRELWQRALKPVRDQLLPELTREFCDPRNGNRRLVCATVLKSYFDKRPEVLADLARDADGEQFRVLFPALRERAVEVAERLSAELNTKPTANGTEADRMARAKQQANAAAALVALGQPPKVDGNTGSDPFEAVWGLLRHSPTPDTRTYLIHGLAPRGADPRLLVRRLEQETDTCVRAALILALGGFSAEQLPDRDALAAKLLGWYRTDPDPGIHGAIDWLLRHGDDGPTKRPLDWGQRQELEKIDRQLAGRPALAGQRWYLNRQGQTFVKVPGPVRFLMGSTLQTDPKRGDNEDRHERTIGHSFAIAAQPVTVKQWQPFLEELKRLRVDISSGDVKMYAPDPHCPIIDVSWYHAAMYCRWLSEQEKLDEDQMVYPPLEEIDAVAKGRKPPPLRTFNLSRTGYRLPTEAEWEYACRAGATTSWHFGGAEELLPRYGWFWTNSDSQSWPVGQKMPNALGLFDVHGNVWNWCHGPYEPYPGPGKETPQDPAKSSGDHVLRGGSFRYKAVLVRSACRLVKAPTFRVSSVGLRVARTIHDPASMAPPVSSRQ